MAGAGAGAFVLASVAEWLTPEARRLRAVGFAVAPAAVGIGCLILAVDARSGFLNPERFLRLAINPRSAMSWGVVLLALFMAVSSAAFVRAARGGRPSRALSAIGAVLALGVAAYTGVLLGDSVAYPLWNGWVLVPLFMASALSSGLSTVLLACRAGGMSVPSRLDFLKWGQVALPAVEAVLIAVLLLVTACVSGSAAPAAQATVDGLLRGSYAPAFWVGLVLVGLAFPAAAGVWRIRRRCRRVEALELCAYAASVFGAFMLRYLVVVAAVPMFA